MRLSERECRAPHPGSERSQLPLGSELVCFPIVTGRIESRDYSGGVQAVDP